MKNLSLICILFLLSACVTKKQEAVDHYLKAVSLFESKNIQESNNEIKQALKLDSNNSNYIILFSKIKSQENQFEEAISLLKPLLTQNSKIDTINFLIAENYFNLGRYFSFQKKDDQKAKENYEISEGYYNDAIKLNSQYFEAYFQKQKALFNGTKYDEALIYAVVGL